MRLTAVLSVGAGLIAASLGDPATTAIHEKGRCAARGHCGKQSFFGKELPCPDNDKAKEPESSLRQKLVDLCGPKWSEGPVCCEEEQVDALASNLKIPQNIIASCPACKENFYNLFCSFTCSPDQSLFVNITQSGKSTSGKTVVTELSQLWGEEYSGGFYNSCKDVQNGATGGKAMDFIGGGAKNYSQFLKFLGDKKAFGLGSPFQINFETEPKGGYDSGMEYLKETPKACNDEDPAFRCACIDCPATCPTLPEVKREEHCHVGLLPCLSFAVILIYCVCLLLLVTAISGHVAYRRHKQRRSERLQLLQDAAPSDDEDEGDVVHNAGMLDRPQRNYYLNAALDRVFSKIGSFSARYPALTIGTNIVVVALLSLGWMRFEVERDPVRLWVSPTSAAAEQKTFFDENFGPFYRAEMAFLVSDISSSGPSPVLSYDTLSWWFDVEARISRLKSPEYELTIDDVCFKPTGDACVINSISGYFPGGFNDVTRDSWKEKIAHCAEHPGSFECLPEFQNPLRPESILGGFSGAANATQAEALVVTWVVNNHPQGSEGEAMAEDWEKAFKSLMLSIQGEAGERGLRLSFSTERSLEEELNQSTNTDAKIVVISYVIMFIYASLALGSGAVTMKSLLNNPSNALVQSKFTLGVVGIIIVLMSVSASVGLFSAAGVKVTLIIAEVIPFLVLAVGVDNIFLIVHEFERVNLSHPDEEIDERVAKALGRMGPSILLSASTETIAFAIGAAVGMPAVKNFAAYAAGAVLINAILQVTMFISVLALNQRRVESLRADCFPCITVSRANTMGVPGGQFYATDEESPLQYFIRKVYAPTILGKKVKTLIIVIFVSIFAAALSLVPEVALGLDQRIAIPDGSYLIDYFNDLYVYLGIGPPVYFVTRDLNTTELVHQQQICGAFSTCDEFSLEYILKQEANRPNVSYITGATASWIDDYFSWLNPSSGCCQENGHDCFADREHPWNVTLYGMPEGEEFIHYLEKWIAAPTDQDCPNAGQAAYSNALVIDTEDTTTPATHFRTSHTPLRSQEDFIDAYAAARRISSDISSRHNIDVFPYSKHYIFFDQYTSIVQLTAALLCAAIAVIFLISSLLLGSFATGFVIAITVIMIVIDIIGVMAIANVSLNAVSLVNLVICVGIGVEFCAHIARAFMFPSRSVMEKARNKFRGKDARAWTALVNVGGSVFSGITITKLLGVVVLAFTRSKIFEVYYFRIWFALVIFASTHALVFLPVALSFAGGEGYIDPESEGSLEEDLATRRYRALLPDDDYDSDDD
ncbi:putative patched sphingolipid transporter [Phaeomoniella chlamydospora]|uniref:Putative patched sphingolipid transporter n=1 Tax=Phaeomoniella chlamydospora TaxID=158046 RepID=A0A0G2ED98_PHACM|nr:putative patched sphingolipid transporter [Phaeomoniella chlamydospora]